MRNLIIIICTILLFSCSNDENAQVQNSVAASSFKYIITDNSASLNTIFTQEYTLDSDDKVLTETYTNYIFPQHNHLSVFQYDDQGRVIAEIRNNELYYRIVWNGNVAYLFNNQNQNIANFTFLNGNLIEYSYGNDNNYKFNYDSNDNVISIENENSVYVEYLDYDTTLSNPMNLIKSIGILRLDYNPYFKNFFETEKAYPYVGDDYSFPLTYYNYSKTVNASNEIISMTNNKTYYISKFEYN